MVDSSDLYVEVPATGSYIFGASVLVDGEWQPFDITNPVHLEQGQQVQVRMVYLPEEPGNG